MSQVSGTLARPQLRGFLHRQIKRNLVLVTIGCFIAGYGTKYFVNDPRKEVYANFYKNYDIEKAFESMRKKGLFDSCPTD